MNNEKLITAWEKATDNIAEAFLLKYFDRKRDRYDEWWVGDEIGGIMCINDYWFDLHTMLLALRCDVSEKILFSYYDYALECHTDDKQCINFETYIRIEGDFDKLKLKK